MINTTQKIKPGKVIHIKQKADLQKGSRKFLSEQVTFMLRTDPPTKKKSQLKKSGGKAWKEKGRARTKTLTWEKT